MNFYEFMDKMDKFCLENQDFDYRNMEVHCCKILGKEFFYIDYDGKTECFMLNK